MSTAMVSGPRISVSRFKGGVGGVWLLILRLSTGRILVPLSSFHAASIPRCTFLPRKLKYLVITRERERENDGRTVRTNSLFLAAHLSSLSYIIFLLPLAWRETLSKSTWLSKNQVGSFSFTFSLFFFLLVCSVHILWFVGTKYEESYNRLSIPHFNAPRQGQILFIFFHLIWFYFFSARNKLTDKYR